MPKVTTPDPALMALAGRNGEVLSPRSTDDEASAILDELSKLQTLLIMHAHQGRVWSASADLVQRTRILIIQRCKETPDVR